MAREYLQMDINAPYFQSCEMPIVKCILDKPIVYPAFTVYFDNDKLDIVRDTYGYDLFRSCLEYVKENYLQGV